MRASDFEPTSGKGPGGELHILQLVEICQIKEAFISKVCQVLWSSNHIGQRKLRIFQRKLAEF